MKIKKILPFILLISTTIFSQNIALDTNYGTNGYTYILGLSSSYVQPYSKQLNDGSILISTSRLNTTTNKEEEIVIKYNSNGIIDTNFGNNGIYVLDIDLALDTDISPIYDDNGIEIILDDNENIYLILSPYKNAIVKLTSQGILDTTFGSNGYITFTDSEYTSSKNVKAIAFNNGIIIGLVKGNDETSKVLKMYNADGTLNTNFGNNGILSVPYDGKMFKLNDGNFLLSQKYDTELLGFVKMSPSGVISTNFGNNGQVFFDKKGYLNYYESINNSIYVSITYDEEVNGQTQIKTKIYKYNSTGEKDMQFGTNGEILIDNLLVYESFIELDNKLYIHGTDYSSFNTSIVSLNIDGTINTNFANNGFFIENTNTRDLSMATYSVGTNSIIIVGKQIPNGSSNTIKHFSAKYNLSNSTASNNDIESLDVSFINPVENTLVINSSKFNIDNIEIYSLQGKVITTSKTNTIKTNTLSQGVYLLKIQLDNGKIVSKKIIKN